MKNARRWAVVVVFAMAMAWVESAVVFYLRTMMTASIPINRIRCRLSAIWCPAELVREAATLVMLLMVGPAGWPELAKPAGLRGGRLWVWDICYYVFLKVICGWPHSLLDWDILFLLPLPWWGPVLAPVLIALLMIVWGTLDLPV